jgi:hypothetical protein
VVRIPPARFLDIPESPFYLKSFQRDDWVAGLSKERRNRYLYVSIVTLWGLAEPVDLFDIIDKKRASRCGKFFLLAQVISKNKNIDMKISSALITYLSIILSPIATSATISNYTNNFNTSSDFTGSFYTTGSQQGT